VQHNDQQHKNCCLITNNNAQIKTGKNELPMQAMFKNKQL
jgi:hypothetical protein